MANGAANSIRCSVSSGDGVPFFVCLVFLLPILTVLTLSGTQHLVGWFEFIFRKYFYHGTEQKYRLILCRCQNNWPVVVNLLCSVTRSSRPRLRTQMVQLQSTEFEPNVWLTSNLPCSTVWTVTEKWPWLKGEKTFSLLPPPSNVLLPNFVLQLSPSIWGSNLYLGLSAQDIFPDLSHREETEQWSHAAPLGCATNSLSLQTRITG